MKGCLIKLELQAPQWKLPVSVLWILSPCLLGDRKKPLASQACANSPSQRTCGSWSARAWTGWRVHVQQGRPRAYFSD